MPETIVPYASRGGDLISVNRICLTTATEAAAAIDNSSLPISFLFVSPSRVCDVLRVLFPLCLGPSLNNASCVACFLAVCFAVDALHTGPQMPEHLVVNVTSALVENIKDTASLVVRNWAGRRVERSLKRGT